MKKYIVITGSILCFLFVVMVFKGHDFSEKEVQQEGSVAMQSDHQADSTTTVSENGTVKIEFGLSANFDQSKN